MRRRHRLRPDTFPFLAVLLCAMGSLIFVLLVLDRRARLAANARAQTAHDLVLRQEEEKEARQKQEIERLLASRQAQLRQRDAELQAQREAAGRELQQAKAAADRAAREAEAEAASRAALLRRIAEEKARLEQARHLAEQGKKALQASEQKPHRAREELQRLAADLLRLEKGLEQVKQRRETEAQTFSVVPWAGKRGLNSRPLYVECDAQGLLFQPDRLRLAGASLEPSRILAEVERRMAAQRQKRPGTPVYWMLLVRPDGIARYYQFLDATRGLDLTFGYEFVDATWRLDFPDPPANPITVAGSPPPSPAPRGSGVTLGPVTVGGERRQPLPPSPRSGGEGSGVKGMSVSSASPLSPSPRSGEGGERQARDEQSIPRSVLPPSTHRLGGGVAITPLFPVGGEKGQPSSSRNGEGGESQARDKRGDPTLVLPLSSLRLGGGEKTTPAGERGEKQKNPPSERGEQGEPGPSPEGTRKQGSLVAPGQDATEKGTPPLGAGLPGPRQKPRVFKPARRESRDWVLEVRCLEDRVEVPALELTIPLANLRSGMGETSLVRAIETECRRREAFTRPGLPSRGTILFLVHRDGERTFHRVYPLLAGVPAAKKHANLEE